MKNTFQMLHLNIYKKSPLLCLQRMLKDVKINYGTRNINLILCPCYKRPKRKQFILLLVINVLANKNDNNYNGTIM